MLVFGLATCDDSVPPELWMFHGGSLPQNSQIQQDTKARSSATHTHTELIRGFQLMNVSGYVSGLEGLQRTWWKLCRRMSTTTFVNMCIANRNQHVNFVFCMYGGCWPSESQGICKAARSLWHWFSFPPSNFLIFKRPSENEQMQQRSDMS